MSVLRTSPERRADEAVAGTAQPAASPAYSWWVVAVLSAGAMVGALDRQIINLMVEPIKAALQISDEQVSLLQGFSIALFYALLAVPIARVADTRNRRNLILGGALLWTCATAGCGLATGYLTLFIARTLVGVGDATLSPAAFSMLSDYFPRAKLAKPVSIFTGAQFFGTGMALVIGGAVFAALHRAGGLTLPGGLHLADWKATFLFAAAPGVVFALLMLTVREPPRGEPQAHVAGGFSELLRFVRRRAGLFAPLYGGIAILSACQFALGSWIPSFFIRTYGWAPAKVGLWYGLLVAFAGTAGVILGGWICDRLKAAGVTSANVWVPIGSSLAAAPFAAAFPLTSDPKIALLLILPLAVLGPMPFGAGAAAIPTVTPGPLRAQMVALYLFLGNLVGVGGGPWLVALVTDRVVGDPALIRYSLATVGPAILVVGSLVLALAVRPFRTALQEP